MNNKSATRKSPAPVRWSNLMIFLGSLKTTVSHSVNEVRFSLDRRCNPICTCFQRYKVRSLCDFTPVKQATNRNVEPTHQHISYHPQSSKEVEGICRAHASICSSGTTPSFRRWIAPFVSTPTTEVGPDQQTLPSTAPQPARP